MEEASHILVQKERNLEFLVCNGHSLPQKVGMLRGSGSALFLRVTVDSCREAPGIVLAESWRHERRNTMGNLDIYFLSQE